MAMTFRALEEKDYEQVSMMDELSGNCVSEWLDTGSSFGAFAEDHLVAYLTMGYADDCGHTITANPLWSIDARILSNVFVRNCHRGQGIGLALLKNTLSQEELIGCESVFLAVMHDSLMGYYSKLGFAPIGEYYMVRPCLSQNVKMHTI